MMALLIPAASDLDIRSTDPAGRTLLLTAVNQGNESMARLLIAGIYLPVRDPYTRPYYAVHTHGVQILLVAHC